MRQFLAVELPESVRVRLLGLRRSLGAAGGAWRWASSEGLHLTLRFLGEVADALDAPARRGWAHAAREVEPFRFRLGAIGAFPPRGRPRVLWIGAKEEPQGALTQLAAAVERAAREGGFAPEPRQFHPHVTLARARRGEAARVPALTAPDDRSSIEVAQIVLYRSDLGPGGARYTALERFPLGTSKGGRD